MKLRQVNIYILIVVICLAVCSCSETDSCKVAMLHMNPEHCQKETNIQTICEYTKTAMENGANIVVTPEMATDDYFLTKEEVLAGSGIKDAEADLAQIAELCKKYDGYVCVGYPEIDKDGLLYNAAVLINPEGNIILHERKKSIPDWNKEGNLEPEVADTEFGKIGIVICADAYMPENVAALDNMGADIILSPVTWYPLYDETHSIIIDPIDVWKSRAQENSVWWISCNRWGVEKLEGKDVDMNMASTVVVSPQGEVVYQYTAGDNHLDNICYYSIECLDAID